MHRLWLVTLAAVFLAGPASAANLTTALGPKDLTTLTLEQRSTLLPPETVITFHGKTTTLGVLRKAHAALLAHFASLGGLAPSMPRFERVVFKNKIETNPGGGILRPIVNPISPGSSATPAPAMVHVPNAAPAPQPADYVAACGKISLCVYIPPFQSYDNGYSFWLNNSLTLNDPLLAPDVCQGDGGTFASGTCTFTYQWTAKISVSPGTPPDLQSSINCPSAAFSTLVDPLGAAEISAQLNALAAQVSNKAIVCAVDLETPAAAS